MTESEMKALFERYGVKVPSKAPDPANLTVATISETVALAESTALLIEAIDADILEARSDRERAQTLGGALAERAERAFAPFRKANGKPETSRRGRRSGRTTGNPKFAKWLKDDERTQAEIARALRCSLPSLQNWRSGKSTPKEETRKLIAKVSGGKVPEPSWS